jgi:hypothetical protein
MLVGWLWSFTVVKGFCALCNNMYYECVYCYNRFHGMVISLC